MNQVIIIFELVTLVLINGDNGIIRDTSDTCDIVTNDESVNLYKLKRTEGYQVIAGNKIFLLNICDTVKNCKNKDVSACMIDNQTGQMVPLGLLSRISFNNNTNELKYKFDKKLQTIIIFKCNRHLKNPKIQYVVSDLHAKKYKFIFETPIFCFNSQKSCLTYDINSNHQYDISSLYGSTRNWIVRNVPNSNQIFLNICGKLHADFKLKNEECLYPGTQICLIDRNGKTTNLGIFSTQLEFTETYLEMSITGGSLCNDTVSIKTIIHFICAFNNSGPMFVFSSDCEYRIKWYTPTACPYLSTVHTNCTINDFLLGEHTEPIYSSQDKEQYFPVNKTIKFNICGVLKNGCHGQKNVSFCFVNNDKEIIYGFTNTTIISKDTEVYMNLYGEICDQRNIRSSVNIIFVCDYDEHEEILVNENICAVNVTVYTKKACRQITHEPNCKTEINGTNYYDISPLITTSHNYEVKDPDDPSKIYILNICQSVVLNNNSMCPLISASCLRNATEPNKYKRFHSLGSYTNSSGLEINNDKLIIQYDGGVICLNGGRSNYKTIIEFRCIHTNDSNIKLLKNKCEYTFIWLTKYACPQYNDETKNLKNISDDKIIANMKDRKSEQKIINDNNDRDNENNNTIQVKNTNNSTDINNKDDIVSKVRSESNNCYSKTDLVTSLYIPVELSNTSEIYIKNCTLKNNTRNIFNMHQLPRTVHVSSSSGKTFYVNVCSSDERKKCANLTDLYVSPRKDFLQMKFEGSVKCKYGNYKSMVFLKCNETFQNLSVLKEDECSVQLEWRNSAFCTMFNPIVTKELQSLSADNSTTVPLAAVLVPIILIVIIIVVSIYFWKRYQRTKYYSSTPLLRCEYRREKDVTKIV